MFYPNGKPVKERTLDTYLRTFNKTKLELIKDQ